MDFGVVLQCDPPAARVVELARRAELYGFRTCVLSALGLIDGDIHQMCVKESLTLLRSTFTH